jgi:4-hydroxybenzoate polyprenyltransferase
MTEDKHSLFAFLWLLRPSRSLMVAVLTGAAAFTSGAGLNRSLWMTLAGWCLAVGGFSLDFYADRELDIKGPRSVIRHNPLADGSVSLRVGLAFSLAFIAASLILVLAISVWGLLPWFGILLIIAGLALHLFETPISRALTLGLLQALYVIMGSTTGGLSPGLWILASMFFFAMFGGRGVIDIRDFLHDEATEVQTMPGRYGVQRTAYFSAVSLIIAYALSLIAYFIGEFGVIYLYLDIAFIAIGLVAALTFARYPTPRLAYIYTFVFMMGMGTLICLAMILGRIFA